FNYCEETIKALDPDGSNAFSGYISQYKMDVAGTLVNDFGDRFGGDIVAQNYTRAISYYGSVQEEKGNQLKDVCVGLTRTAKSRLDVLRQAHNKEINNENAQAIADFFNPYINLINARCEFIHAEALEIKAKNISPYADLSQKMGDFLDTWDNSSTTTGRNAGFSPQSDDFVSENLNVRKALDKYAQTPFVRNTRDIFNALFAVPVIQLDRHDPSSKMPNPLNRLMASKTLNSKLGFDFLIQEGFLNACMRYGKPFGAQGLSGFERIRLGRTPMTTPEEFQKYKNTLKETVKKASEGKDIEAFFTGSLILTAKEEVTELLTEAKEKADDDIKTCLDDRGLETLLKLHEEKACLLPPTDDDHRVINVRENANEDRQEIISRYLTTAPALAIEYIKNSTTPENFDALCASLLASYDKLETKETVMNALDIAIFVSAVLSYGTSSYVTIPFRVVLVAASAIDGVMSIKTISEMNSEISTIKEMQAAEFIDYDVGQKMTDLASSNIGAAAISLIIDATFIYSGLKGLKLLPLRRTPKAEPPVIAETPKAELPKTKTRKEPDVIEEPQTHQLAMDFEETKLPKQFTYKKVDPTSVERMKLRITDQARALGIDIRGEGPVVDFLAKRSASLNNFARQMRFCKAMYPSTKVWWKIGLAGTLIRVGTTYDGYKRSLGKHKFNVLNFSADAGSGVLKEWVYAYFIVKNSVKVNNSFDFKYRTTFSEAVKSWAKKFGKTYIKTLPWALGTEVISNSFYFLTGTAADQYGEEHKWAATRARSEWGGIWAAGVAVPLKMTLYELVMGLTCMVPGVKIFAKASGLTRTVTAVVLSYGAQTAYSEGTSVLYYQGRNWFMHDVCGLELLDSEHKKPDATTDDKKTKTADLGSEHVVTYIGNDGEDPVEISFVDQGTPSLTKEEENNGYVLYELVPGDSEGNLDYDPSLEQ
ncbi:MAG: hypothetical protein V1647_05565, partial [Pseudomonadota bacterium]